MTNEPTEKNKAKRQTIVEDTEEYSGLSSNTSFFSGFDPVEKPEELNKTADKANSQEPIEEKAFEETAEPEKAKNEAAPLPTSTPTPQTQSDHPDRPADFAPPVIKKKNKKRSTPVPTTTEKKEADDYIYARYRKTSKRSRGNQVSKSENLSKFEETSMRETPVVSHSDQHRRYHKKIKWRNKTTKQKVLTIVSTILCTVILLLVFSGISYGVLVIKGNRQLTNYDEMDMSAPSIEDITVNNGGKNVVYKGKTYIFNEDITSILCMGVDKRELGIDDNTVGTGGQADAIYLVALNTKTGETDVVAIPRDTWTDIGIYDPNGDYVGTEKHQLCLAYAYGDGKETSCRNTVTATERLFFGLPIASYFSMDESAISALTDAVGGVTLTLTNDTYVDPYEVQHYSGETITIHGYEAERFLRLRDVTQLESSVNRMERQISFLKAFTSKAIEMTKKDLTIPLKLYGIVKDNSITNLTPSKITAFATAIVTNGISELEFTKVPGNLTSDGTYAQYIVDEEAFYENILDIYYTPTE